MNWSGYCGRSIEMRHNCRRDWPRLTSPTGLPEDSILFDKNRIIPQRNYLKATTESWDVPTYSAGLPPYILTQVQNDLAADTTHTLAGLLTWLPPHNITDLLKAYYYYQLRNNGAPPLNPIAAANQANSMVNSMTYAQLTALFAPEMLAGLKMNVNRPFPGPGNGVGNNPNSYSMAALWQTSGIGGNYGNFWFGLMPDFPDGTSNPNIPFAAPAICQVFIRVGNVAARSKSHEHSRPGTVVHRNNTIGKR